MTSDQAKTMPAADLLTAMERAPRACVEAHDLQYPRGVPVRIVGKDHRWIVKRLVDGRVVVDDRTVQLRGTVSVRVLGGGR